MACALPLCACGKKPPHVDLPPDAQDNAQDAGKGAAFPHVYPDPKYNK